MGSETTPSATQQQVSETLCDMGLSVEDEIHCPKSGYFIDMLVEEATAAVENSNRWLLQFPILARKFLLVCW